MVLSMTGFGDGRRAGPTGPVAVEVRAVNNRHLKVTVRGTDPYPLLEPEFERLVRRAVRRGTVQVRVHVDRRPRPADLRLNVPAVAAYLAQLKAACHDAGTPDLLPALAAGVLALPGVAPEPGHAGGPPDDEWPAVEAALADALAALDAARRAEGRAMAADLLGYHADLAALLDRVKAAMPAVLSGYRDRLADRVRAAVADAGVAVAPDHLVREVALFADRSDVAEEVTRFAAHLAQFADVLAAGGGADGAGRRLEFVAQEMGREANTLGAKAGDPAVGRLAIDIKITLEKVRELVQNVE